MRVRVWRTRDRGETFHHISCGVYKTGEGEGVGGQEQRVVVFYFFTLRDINVVARVAVESG